MAAASEHGAAMTEHIASFAPTRRASPCTGVCVIDPVSHLCRGCRRTLGEIAGWAGMGEAERAAVWAVLDERG